MTFEICISKLRHYPILKRLSYKTHTIRFITRAYNKIVLKSLINNQYAIDPSQIQTFMCHIKEATTNLNSHVIMSLVNHIATLNNIHKYRLDPFSVE
jgi:hypothetical protein